MARRWGEEGSESSLQIRANDPAKKEERKEERKKETFPFSTDFRTLIKRSKGE